MNHRYNSKLEEKKNEKEKDTIHKLLNGIEIGTGLPKYVKIEEVGPSKLGTVYKMRRINIVSACSYKNRTDP